MALGRALPLPCAFTRKRNWGLRFLRMAPTWIVTVSPTGWRRSTGRPADGVEPDSFLRRQRLPPDSFLRVGHYTEDGFNEYSSRRPQYVEGIRSCVNQKRVARPCPQNQQIIMPICYVFGEPMSMRPGRPSGELHWRIRIRANVWALPRLNSYSPT